MQSQRQSLWQRISRTGLRDDEGVIGHREVIFLNQVIAVTPIFFIVFIPLDIFFNGFKVVPLDFIFLLLMMIPLGLNYLRQFWLARLVCLLSIFLFIAGAGLIVGKGINNHIPLISMVLFGVILFKRTLDRLLSLALAFATYGALVYLWDRVEPTFHFDTATQQTFTHVFYCIGLTTTFLLGFYFVRINSEYESLIIKQRETLSEKNREVLSSIEYAQRIQRAKLPPQQRLFDVFKNSFIIYLPKDIVSGDFYFLQQQKSKLFIGACDCTGHGVPGALMSMISSEILSKTITAYNSINEVLEETDRQLTATLQQDADSPESADGMDCALVSWDTDSNTLEYAGANRPLWIIRKETATIAEIKPTKRAVGGTRLIQTAFTTTKLKLQQGDRVFLFTDGIADQFGGPEGKKFMTKRLKSILEENVNLSIEQLEQKLMREWNSWKGNLEQVDDILIIAFEID